MIERIDYVRPPLWWRRLGSIVVLSVVLLLLLFSSLKHTTITITTTTTIAGTIAMKKTTIMPQLQHSSSPAVVASSLSLSYLEQLIPLNTNSSYVLSDIVRILHKPKEQFQIEVHLKDDSNVRQCKNPIFIGRISGWSLSMIEFDYDYQKEKYRSDNADNINNNTNKSRNIIVGKYDQSKFPKSGTYYIEILILLCEEPNYWSDDLYKVCLKDSNIPKTRVTTSPVTITINIDENEDEVATTVVGTSSTGNKPHFGRWLHKSFIEEGRNNRKKRHVDVPQVKVRVRPLYTRYQPFGCMDSDNFKSTKNTTECQTAVDLLPFGSYKFVWDDSYMNRPLLPVKYFQQRQNQHPTNRFSNSDSNNNNNNDKTTVSSSSTTHVCFIGLSHSGTLVKKCNSLLQRHTKKKNTTDDNNNNNMLPFELKCSHIQVKFPFEIIRGGPPDEPITINNDNNNHVNLTQQQQQQTKVIQDQLHRRRQRKQQEWVHINLIQPKCTHAVIGLYQWPFSFYQKQINSQLYFENWRRDIIDVIQIINRNINNDDNDRIEIILRSVHTNGLKEHITSCPPIDFRSPYNTKISNQILQDIVTATNKNTSAGTASTSDASSSGSSSNDNDSSISYINTNFITEPVWDSKLDWSHLNDESGTEEIKYILYEILRRRK